MGRSLRGERGLKLFYDGTGSNPSMSLPPRGAWIEIFKLKRDVSGVGGRSLRGERGLKSASVKLRSHVISSLPPRGAWIEMRKTQSGDTRRKTSLPPRGAWIEIPWDALVDIATHVAPSAGSVD